MALSSSEKWQGGFVVNVVTLHLAVTMQSAGAQWSGGFLRDPDGRLVVRAA